MNPHFHIRLDGQVKHQQLHLLSETCCAKTCDNKELLVQDIQGRGQNHGNASHHEGSQGLRPDNRLRADARICLRSQGSFESSVQVGEPWHLQDNKRRCQTNAIYIYIRTYTKNQKETKSMKNGDVIEVSVRYHY